jgi:hypothetical protein
LKKEALNRTVWKARFGRGFGPVVKQTTTWWTPNQKFLAIIIHRFSS